jgi:hypothetical protein
MTARAMLLHLAGVVTGLGVCLAGALWWASGEAAHVILGALLFAAGAAGVGLQGWYAVKGLDGGATEGAGRMTLQAIAARVERLDELSRGLAKELTLIREADDPLLYVERKAYLGALGRVLSGVEEARVALARVRQRLEGGRAP